MKATVKHLSRLVTATHGASKRGRNGSCKVHAVWLSPNGRVAVPCCGAPHFYWESLHDAHDKHTGTLNAKSAVLGAWGCKKCQAGLDAGTIEMEA